MSILDAIKAAKERAVAFDGPRAKKPGPGRTRWRILPHWSGDQDQLGFHYFGLHYIKDLAGETQAVYVCVNATYGRECEVCSAMAAAVARSGGDPVVANVIDDSKVQTLVLVNAMAVEEKPDGTVKYSAPELLSLPRTVWEKDLLAAAGEHADAGINIFALEGGHDVIINKTGTSFNTRYAVTVHPKATNLPREIMAKAINLEKYVAQENPANLTRALSAVSALGLAAAPPPAPTTGVRALEGVTVEATPALAAPPTPTLAEVEPITIEAETEAEVVKTPPAAPSAEVIDIGDIDLEGLEDIQI